MLKNWELLRKIAVSSGRVWVAGLLQRPEAKSRATEKKTMSWSGWLWCCSTKFALGASKMNITPPTGRGQQRKMGYSLARAILGVGRKAPCSQYGMNGRNGVQNARSVKGLCSLVQTRHLGLQPRGALETL